MTPDLKTELRQRKPFSSLAEEAFLSIARTDAVFSAAMERLYETHGISSAQYNILRILRGAGRAGLCRNEIRDRLISRMPDVTRLLDRMEAAGLISRERSTADRRMVATYLTERGRKLVDALDAPVAAEHKRRFGHMTAQQLQTLIALLAVARTGA
jgi:DNA-binding MarR family transcriptional regulator